MSRLTALKGWLPEWLRPYRAQWLSGDLTAGFIVTVMLIPQSLAYAMLAGLPLQVGIYASIAPLVVYALFGTSMTLAVTTGRLPKSLSGCTTQAGWRAMAGWLMT